jgi:anaerobic magnesium-protoporphyrin IX monomethyl ester cyclase
MSKPDISLVFPSSPFLENPIMFPPLGIMYLSAYLKIWGLNAQCLDMALGHTADMAEADIIGLSFTTPQRDEAYKLAKYYKSIGKTVIAGGPHPTHMKKECLENGIDKVLKGYGEIPLVQYLMGKSFQDDYLYGIDSRGLFCPFPDRDALPIKAYYQEIENRPATPIIASRGCCYSCSFCSKISKKFYVQNAERTILELEHLENKYGFRAFSIYDDTIAIDRQRLKVMAERLKDHDYKFRCFCRADLLGNDDICRDLAIMGVTDVGIGVESGSNEILKLNMKRSTRVVNTLAVKNLQRYGIRAKAFLIVGLPGETRKTVQETEEWIEYVKPDDIAVSVFQPLPGSDIFRNPEKWGIEFEYGTTSMWYRGKPGEYQPTMRTKELSTQDIIELRDSMERKYGNHTVHQEVK